jgi:hypothetical protein
MQLSSSLTRIALVVAIAAVVIVAAVFGIRYALVSSTESAQKAASELASKASSSLATALGITPKVTINGLTVIEQRSSIAELAVLQQPVFKEYSWSHTWLGSTKTLVLRGEFIAKTGLNLKEPLSLALATSSLGQRATLTLSLPPARLLSLEMKTYIVQKDESGFWNNITADDRQQAVNAMQAEVRASVLASGILADTEREAEQRIRTICEEFLRSYTSTHTTETSPTLILQKNQEPAP